MREHYTGRVLKLEVQLCTDLVGSLLDMKPKVTQLMCCIPHVHINRECFIHIIFIVTEMLSKGRICDKLSDIKAHLVLYSKYKYIILGYNCLGNLQEDEPATPCQLCIHQFIQACIHPGHGWHVLWKPKKKGECEERLLYPNTASHMLQSTIFPLTCAFIPLKVSSQPCP